MSTLRAFLRHHRQLAGLLVALAIAMKALVPAGYMVGTQARTITMELCADASGGHVTREVVIARGDAPGTAEHGKADGVCTFSALAMAALGGADAVLLAAALVFILLLGIAAVPVFARRNTGQLRPPLRGPPAFA